MNEPKKRKTTRLAEGNYSASGSVFITICTENKKCVLSRIDTDVLNENGSPTVRLLPRGKIAEKYLKEMSGFYEGISIDRFVIMPNHIHFILTIENDNETDAEAEQPIKNSIVSRFISTFKRFCNKEYGGNIWQYRSYDHIIRNPRDYDDHAAYIADNPRRWVYDKLYTPE